MNWNTIEPGQKVCWVNMPRVLYEEGFSFSFYAADGAEPPHVHIFKDGHSAKCWLDPIRLARSRGFKAPDEARFLRIIQKNHSFLLDAWRHFFSEG